MYYADNIDNYNFYGEVECSAQLGKYILVEYWHGQGKTPQEIFWNITPEKAALMGLLYELETNCVFEEDGCLVLNERNWDLSKYLDE